MIAPSDGARDPQAVRIGGGFTAADLVNPGTWLRDGSAFIGAGQGSRRAERYLARAARWDGYPSPSSPRHPTSLRHR